MKEFSLKIILLGVCAVMIVGLILFLKSDRLSPKDISPEIDYLPFIGVYEGESIITSFSPHQSGQSRFNIKEIDNDTKDVVVEVDWYHGLYGNGRLFGDVVDFKIDLKGVVSSEGIGSCDIEMTINLKTDSGKIDGSYKLYPVAGNLIGTQNGRFELFKK